MRIIVFTLWLFTSAIVLAEEQVMEEVIVLAHPLSAEGLSQAVEVLQGEALQQKVGASIGETLGKQPGIHSAQFGNAVGRPVIHGLGGPRVRIMEDRIDTLDVSVTSGDHAVAVEPFIAERIEVMKGASTLLYGSGAIGGVVDVHTARIPHDLPDQPFSGGIETRFDNNTNGNTTAAKLNGGKGSFAWHVDGTVKEGDQYEIPGFTRSKSLRLQEPALTDSRGVLPGSEFDATSAAVGGSYIADWGFAGLSVSRLTAEYGLPGLPEADELPTGADDRPTLDLEQTRTDIEIGVTNPFGIFSGLNIRVGHNDYQHQEIEPDGETGTEFTNRAFEARAELIYETEQWHQVVGLQYADKAFSATGEEAFIQPVDTRDGGVFWVGERSFNAFDFETGLRVGRVTHDPSIGRGAGFTTYAASAGVVVPLGDTLELGVVADYSSRAPVAEELYSDGPHLTTATFERGDASLDNERALNTSVTLRFDGRKTSATVTAYYTRFVDFIYQQATGASEDDLPVVEYRQDDATFFGLDAEFSFNIASWQSGDASLNGMFDFVEAELDVPGNDNLPRISPLRYGMGISANWHRLSASMNYLRVTEQDEVANLELASPAYNDLSLYLQYQLVFSGDETLDLFIRGKNLTDDEQRVHNSFIKDIAPSPGRSIELGARLIF